MAGYSGTTIYDSPAYSSYAWESEEDFKRQCKEALKEIRKHHMERPPIKEWGFVFATTSSLQVEAEALLEKFGFTKGETYSAPKYKGVSRQTIWTMAAAKFCELVGY